ncbi:beta-ketoacyl-ACP synthase 3 [Nocardia terpenica]|uniref:Beta-ketoacyl-ACP synthase 3 n=1 Tax=Nocardia terpenica TaxID=455432 RepID=A0A6G9Z9G6_9NOCA|nr:beta-ketoacyl-ACP synthase 3 [Nocardia terpenica]QIS22060.1 beta-ketoacyl-ACP synthase 3 [Nocardia terpenica]
MTANGTRISGLGSYRPGRPVKNDELATRAGVDPDWIKNGTGIETRYHAGPDDDIVTMAVAAGRQALENAKVAPDEVDLVILTTSSRRQLMPAGAPQVATGLGIPGAGAFDLGAVCAGFSYALSMASNAVAVGQARNVLIASSERLSDLIEPGIREPFVIFGDGAGAAVVSSADQWGIGPVSWGSDGSRASAIETEIRGDTDLIMMQGQAVYRWATGKMPAAATHACELAGVGLDEIAWFVPHQANLRIVDMLATQLGFAPTQVARDVVDTGNTSSATIPIALQRLYESSDVRSGDLALLIGFGSGLSHAAQVVRL